MKFNTMNETVVTMTAGSGVKEGDVCKLTGNFTVGVCSDGDAFCGVCGCGREGRFGVMLRGLVTVKYSGSTAPSVGISTLSADGTGGVAVDADGAGYLVCAVDTTAKTVSFVM